MPRCGRPTNRRRQGHRRDPDQCLHHRHFPPQVRVNCAGSCRPRWSARPARCPEPHGQGALILSQRVHLVQARAASADLRVQDLELDPAAGSRTAPSPPGLLLRLLEPLSTRPPLPSPPLSASAPPGSRPWRSAAARALRPAWRARAWPSPCLTAFSRKKPSKSGSVTHDDAHRVASGRHPHRMLSASTPAVLGPRPIVHGAERDLREVVAVGGAHLGLGRLALFDRGPDLGLPHARLANPLVDRERHRCRSSRRSARSMAEARSTPSVVFRATSACSARLRAIACIWTTFARSASSRRT